MMEAHNKSKKSKEHLQNCRNKPPSPKIIFSNVFLSKNSSQANRIRSTQPCKSNIFHSICNFRKQIHKAPHKIFSAIFSQFSNFPVQSQRNSDTSTFKCATCETKHHESLLAAKSDLFLHDTLILFNAEHKNKLARTSRHA